MSIEKTLERIATALETLASGVPSPMVTEAATPPASSTTPVTASPNQQVDAELTPAQKGAATKARKKAEAAAAAATTTPPGNVVPMTAAVANSPMTAAEVTAPVEEGYIIPGDLAAMTQMTLEVFHALGPRGPEVGELLANVYKVEHVNALPVDYYAGFARDLQTLKASA